MKYPIVFRFFRLLQKSEKTEPHLKKLEAETNRPSMMSAKSRDEKFFLFFFVISN